MNNLVEKKKYLSVYQDGIKTGLIPGFIPNGLCSVRTVDGILLEDDDLFNLFRPVEGKALKFGYWAFDGEHDALDCRAFTPLRQTIVLFLAAMNNEL